MNLLILLEILSMDLVNTAEGTPFVHPVIFQDQIRNDDFP